MNKDKTFSDLSEPNKEALKQAYMEGVTITELADKYGLKRTSLSYHANKYWKKELELRRSELFESFSSSKRANFIRMSESAIKVMDKALRELAQREFPPTIREAKDATDILESLDKITRLDDGNPTDIIAEKPVSIIELRDKLKIDPFYEEVEDVEFKQIEEGSKENNEESN